jgi:hypothetical protein
MNAHNVAARRRHARCQTIRTSPEIVAARIRQMAPASVGSGVARRPLTLVLMSSSNSRGEFQLTADYDNDEDLWLRFE